MESIEKEFTRLIKEKVTMQNEITNKKLAQRRAFYLLFELFIGVIGYGLIIHYYSVGLAVGIWVVLWSNNMGINRTVFGRTRDRLKNLWKNE